ncbi:MAG: hypothetical protein U0V48_08990 [Anaerolineales bacterium]
MLIALSACAQMPASTPAPPPTIALSPTLVTPTASTVPTLKVKNNNLLFVEFFGIT